MKTVPIFDACLCLANIVLRLGSSVAFAGLFIINCAFGQSASIRPLDASRNSFVGVEPASPDEPQQNETVAGEQIALASILKAGGDAFVRTGNHQRTYVGDNEAFPNETFAIEIARLENSSFRDTDLVLFEKLPSLIELSLGEGLATDTALASIARCRRLRSLKIKSSKLTDGQLQKSAALARSCKGLIRDGDDRALGGA